MVTQPAYLKAFKDYTRTPYQVTHSADQAVKDLKGESDRGAVILSATRVEDTLEWAVMQKMEPLWQDSNGRSAMFGANGTNSTFSAKILLAYALGVIDREARNQIDLIREIRNGCAHGRLPISFERPELQGICSVAAAEIIAEFRRVGMKDMPPASEAMMMRDSFVLTCVLIEQYITTGAREPPSVMFSQALEQIAQRRS